VRVFPSRWESPPPLLLLPPPLIPEAPLPLSPPSLHPHHPSFPSIPPVPGTRQQVGEAGKGASPSQSCDEDFCGMPQRVHGPSQASLSYSLQKHSGKRKSRHHIMGNKCPTFASLWLFFVREDQTGWERDTNPGGAKRRQGPSSPPVPMAPGTGGLSISQLGFSRCSKISWEINEEAKFSSSSWRRPGRAVPGPAELADVV